MGAKMLRLKNLITTCGLALTVSFGLSLACPSYSLAGTVTFDYSGDVLSYYNGQATATGYYSVVGSFSINSSLFNGTADQFIDNSNISSVSFTVKVLQDLTPIDGSVPLSVGTYTLNSLGGGSTEYNSTTTTPTLVNGTYPAPDFLAFDSNYLHGLIIGLNGGPGAAFVAFTWPQFPAPFNDNIILGTWTTVVSPSATPLPAALPLFATGLGALGLLARRRKRKNAAALAA